MAANDKLLEYRIKYIFLPIGLIVGVLIGGWIFVGYYLSRAIMWLKLHEMSFVSWFYNTVYLWGDIHDPIFVAKMEANPSGYWIGVKLYNLDLAIKQYYAMYESGMAFKIVDLTNVLYFFNNYMFPFYMVIAIMIFINGYYKMNGGRFKEEYNMDTLIEREKHLYPELAPIVGLDLVSTYGDIDDANWGPPLTEYEFAHRHKLLLEGRHNIEVDEHGNKFQKLNKSKANEIFQLQLDERFYDFENMLPHRKAVFALIGIMTNKNIKDKESNKERCIRQVRKLAKAFAANHNQFDPSIEEMGGEWINEFYAEFSNNEAYKKHVLCKHAYELTVFATLYSAGLNIQSVMPTSYFKWLKKVDRKLYFVLNAIGRQNTHFVEVAGIMTHWLIEKDSNMPHIEKKTINAVKALETELKKYIRDDALDMANIFRKR